jgi:hypothetical protein
LLPGEESSLPNDAVIVDQVPQASGAAMTRVLSDRQPREDAIQNTPSLQDGYLWLVGQANRA